ncbi:hypothetical protein KP509_18G033700 [Ceratopteris richardii]|nr:hypothetical protein KP509_18G033700 [Ceratopteris richardii]KAH7365540.1 hypothetical protein KP509_18G033700 [Ceratopteris richardii]
MNNEAYTIVALLKSCTDQKDLQRGCELHADAVDKGLLEGNVFLGSALVNMYAKCGALNKAQDVFDEMTTRNVVSWNALIGGYAQSGCGEEALRHFERMQIEFVSPNAITYACALKACTIIRALDKGQRIYAKITEKQLLRGNAVLINSVIDMYIKCGAHEKAREVFDEFQPQDVFSWTTIITGYIHHGNVKEAFSLYDMMHEKGISPNGVTFTCILKACADAQALYKGEEVHGHAAEGSWLEKEVSVANAVIDMYAKCGALGKAKEVFDNLASPDIVSFNVLITGYVQHGYSEYALGIYKHMRLNKICPNAVTLSCLLKACGNMALLESGQHIHAHILRVGLLGRDTVVANALMDMYSKCSVLTKAREIFIEMHDRDVVSWTTMIVGYVEHGFNHDALKCFEQMQLDGFSPDAITFACVLKACGNIKAAKKGQNIHALLQKSMLEQETLVVNSLIDMYAKCGLTVKAQKVFDQLKHRDVISWNALIAGYVQHECYEKAANCFHCMQVEGFLPDAFTFACMSKVCAGFGAFQLGQKIHSEVVKYGILEKDSIIGTGLVDMYANCGMLLEAKDVFDKLPNKTVVLWSAFMEGYAQFGKDEIVINALDKMIQEGGLPDSITMTILLNVYSHRGLLVNGQSYFELMSEDYGVTPGLEHYTCMVDLFGRAGHFDEAASLIKEMPFSVNLTLLNTFLGACKNWENLELGTWAFEWGLQLHENDGASFVGMSNLFGAFSMEEDTGGLS